MINPSIDILVTKVDSKYTLVVLAAKRAERLVGRVQRFHRGGAHV